MIVTEYLTVFSTKLDIRFLVQKLKIESKRSLSFSDFDRHTLGYYSRTQKFQKNPRENSKLLLKDN